jgi:hypothetical protein
MGNTLGPNRSPRAPIWIPFLFPWQKFRIIGIQFCIIFFRQNRFDQFLPPSWILTSKTQWFQNQQQIQQTQRQRTENQQRSTTQHQSHHQLKISTTEHIERVLTYLESTGLINDI